MDRQQLKLALYKLGVNPKRYAFDTLESDAVILYQNYSLFEVFYLSERGNRDMKKSFSSEAEACEYVYNLFAEPAK